MKNLVIIGAGSYGREIYNLALECNGYGTNYVIKGYIDNLYEEVGYTNYPSILGIVDEYTPEENDVFVCALMDVDIKKKYIDIILEKGGSFISLIHKSARIWQNTTIGSGCIICDNVSISCDVQIGNFVTIQTLSIIGHDCEIGDYSHLNCFTFLGGKCKVGELSTINTGAILHPGKKTGCHALVGAGSVVLRNVKDGKAVFGNPADYIEF